MVSSEAILASAQQFYHSIETPAYVWLEDENPHEAAVGRIAIGAEDAPSGSC